MRTVGASGGTGLARLLGRTTATPAAHILLALSAMAVLVGAAEHAFLFAGRYGAVPTVGPLFLVNAIVSVAAVLLLLDRRLVAYVVAALAVSLLSIGAILLTHGGGLFGYQEGGYDGHGTVTLVAEILAVMLVAAAIVADRGARAPRGRGRRVARSASGAGAGRGWRAAAGVTATVLVAALACGALQPAGPEHATPTRATGTTTSRPRVVAAVVQRGRDVFGGAGACGGCHTLADAGTRGRVGPDLDQALSGRDQAFIRRGIVDPQATIAEGYAGDLMPQEYGERLDARDLDALVRYLEAVANP